MPTSIDEDLLGVIPTLITTEENARLTKVPDSAKVKSVVFRMDKDSSLGPDGFTGQFFTSILSVCANDACLALQSIFVSNALPYGFNANFIALIPKIKIPTRVNHFHPICMAKFLMKVISKLLQVKLSSFIDKLVST